MLLKERTEKMGKLIKMEKYKKAIHVLSVTNEEYRKSLQEIECYQTQLVKDCTIPDLNFSSEYLEKVRECYKEIKSILDRWVINIYNVLKEYPTNLEIVVVSTKKNLTNAMNNISYLLEKGYNDVVAQNLKISMDIIDKNVTSTAKKCEALYTSITHYADKEVLEVGKNLNEMIELLAKNEEVDNQKVKELNDAIHELKKDIAENAIAIGGFLAADAILIGSVVLIGVLGTPLAGVMSAVVFAVPVIVATTYIVLDSIKIDTDRKLVEAKQEKLNLYESDLVLMKECEETYQNYVTKTQDISSQFSKVSEAWNDICKDVSSIKEAVEKALEDMAAGKDTGRETLLEIQKEVQTALDVTQDLEEKVKGVKINEPSVSLANVMPGMSQSELEETLTKAKSVPYSVFILAS